MRPSPTLTAPAKLTTAAVLASITAAFVLGLFGGSAQAYFDYEGSVPTQIGGPCTGEEGAVCEPGQLRSPTGVAKDTSTSLTDPSAGDVYVADPGDSRVSKFSAAGTYISELTGAPTPFSGVSAVAVDNSTNPLDPSAGDVYVVDNGNDVVDKFSPTGQYLSQITGTPEGRFEQVHAVAVDPEGGVWISILHTTVSGELTKPTVGLVRFTDAEDNVYVSKFVLSQWVSPSGAVAVDSNTAVYFATEEKSELLKLTASGLNAGEFTSCCVNGIAVNADSGDVYATGENSVTEYDSAGNLIQQFGAADLTDAKGLAIDPTSGDAYVADSALGEVDVFTPSVLPSVKVEPPSGVTASSVTLNGIVEPDGSEVTSCVFEYGSEAGAYGQSVPCSSPFTGSPPYASPVPVSATLTGIERGKVYHYRLVARNAEGTNYGADGTFVDPAPVVINGESVVNLASDSATLEAQIDPGGARATYRFEYGTSESYGMSVPVPDGTIEATTGGQGVSEHVQGLQPATVYHYRVVATSALGTALGVDHAFTTPTVGLGAVPLPDGRAYELVSPPEKEGYEVDTTEGFVEGADVPQASAEGATFTYTTNGPVAGPRGSSVGSQMLSSRGPDGWSSQDISLRRESPTAATLGHLEYEAFSSDLSTAIIDPFSTDIMPTPEETPLSSPSAPAGYRVLYSRNDATGGLQPLTTSRPSVEPLDYWMHFLGASPDLSHVVVSTGLGSFGTDLDESYNRQLQPVNVLPDGSTPPAVLGDGGERARHAVSTDGSLVLWTEYCGAGDACGMFVRDMDTNKTIPIGTGMFATASSDLSKIFFINGDLYEYDLNQEKTVDLTIDSNPADGHESSVQGVLGASEDGSTVYFVAKGALENGEDQLLRNPQGARPSSGAENLYMLHEQGETWTTSFIATLSEADGSDWGGATARVTSDGRYLAFDSAANLTGYDDRDAHTGQADQEVFVYDAQTHRLSCASCDPTGAQPTGSSGLSGALHEGTYLPRDLSEDGRVFFDTADSLVPGDTDGTQDVYEWEPGGVGSCQLATGCLALISAGTGAGSSTFLDASADGNDVFFVTRDQLVRQDFDDSFDVYDAHVCSASAPCSPIALAQPPSCESSDQCRAAPLPQPGIFGSPPSATFSGAGNLAPAASVKAKAKAKPTRCRKGYLRKKNRCVKKHKAKKSNHRKGSN